MFYGFAIFHVLSPIAISSRMRFLVISELDQLRRMTNFHARYLQNPEYSNYIPNIQQTLHNLKDNFFHAWLLSKFLITYTQETIINYIKVVWRTYG